jgi:putative DNA primase/helicase
MTARATPLTSRRARAGGRPTIITTHMDLEVVTQEALAALAISNEPRTLFLLGDAPVRVEPHPEDGRPLTRELTEARVVNELARAAQWVKRAHDGQPRPAPPPSAVARNVLASRTLPFPSLERIVEVPVFGRDGSLCATPGYHEGPRLLYQPAERLDIPTIAPQACEAEIEAAGALLSTELLGDFPFVSTAERAHALALLLLPFARDLIEGPTPLHLIEKPTAGTGGSLLADVLLRPALGRALPAMTAGRDTDEMRKRITAVLSESPVAVLFDNAQRLDSNDLAAVLTATVWKDRPLGVSRVVQFPVRCAWIATANNPALTFEVTRRTVRIRLDAETDRPWLRDGFRHPDLVAWVMTHRGELIAAALTLIQAWLVRGRPRATHPLLGSYESWSRVMGGILETAQIPGFLSNLTAFYDDVVDDETEAWHALIAAWRKYHGDKPVGVQDIWALTQGDMGVDLDLGDKGERSQRTRLGKTLGRMRDRIFGGYRVTAAGSFRGAQRWRLRDSAGGLDGARAEVAPAAGVNVANVANVSAPITHKQSFSRVGRENVHHVHNVHTPGESGSGRGARGSAHADRRAPARFSEDNGA